MARPTKKRATRKRVVSQHPRKAPSRPITALLLFFIALCSFVAIWDFEKSQSRQVQTEPEANLVGWMGAEGSFWAFYVFGVATWLFPVFIFWIGVRYLIQQPKRKRLATVFATGAAVLCASGLAAMLQSTGIMQLEGGLFEHQLMEGVGGMFGVFVAQTMEPIIGAFGSFMLLLTGFMLGSMVIFSDNLGTLLAQVQKTYHQLLSARSESSEERKKLRAERAEAKRLAKVEAKRQREEAKAQAKADRKAAKAAKPAAAKRDKADDVDDEANDAEPRPSLLNARPGPPPDSSVRMLSWPSTPVRVAESKLRPNHSWRIRSHQLKCRSSNPKSLRKLPLAKQKLDPATIKIISGEKTEKAAATIPEQRGDYKFPPINLLSEAPDMSKESPEDHAATMEALVRTLEEFGVKVIPGEIHTGPVITRYEVKPAPGVRVEKIVNLDKNIALGLKAMSVRILAPVPGKGTVGIEVPNKIAQAVCMRDIVESRAWADAQAEIPIVLGKDVTGKPMVTDLTKMPHVLIAGSTGSGKTVCINAIIASLLYHSGPEDIRFIMVDPKVVEMQMYNALPHMLIPVVTEAKKVPGALKWLIAEMERRYQIFATENVRNIAGFNAKIAKTKAEKEKAAEMEAELNAEMTPEERAAVSKMEVPRDDDAFEIPRKKLPYIVCIIDELADLMMVAPADIETGIARLAQLARAAGIHLILATQRPSVNVITGVIKANLPSRISFKVASKVDSRTILDGGGAEALIGKGDMLFIPPGTSNLVRAQGAFVSDDEINGVVDYLKEHNDPPNFAEEIQNQIDAGGDEGGGSSAGDEGGDELLGDAIDVLRSTKRASTSMLQRRLRIGYNRAARLMEELEDRGIVGPENGSSPREIMVDLDAM